MKEKNDAKIIAEAIMRSTAALLEAIGLLSENLDDIRSNYSLPYSKGYFMDLATKYGLTQEGQEADGQNGK